MFQPPFKDDSVKETSGDLPRFPEDSGDKPYAGEKWNSVGQLGVWAPTPVNKKNYALQIKHREKDRRPIMILYFKNDEKNTYEPHSFAWLEPLHENPPETGKDEMYNHVYSKSLWRPLEEADGPYKLDTSRPIGGRNIVMKIEAGFLRMAWIPEPGEDDPPEWHMLVPVNHPSQDSALMELYKGYLVVP
ncbi:hypothetical protein CSIM01_00572 [Colletotrichum simmondsii]|uniref:Uncharacterized protein n=1 Tax=Colletotrichum simmondsii TaxID=703756 RepID=A0A135SIV7_9PEZI|nr:hypothetical protein CSIM01_00572 [Colletotrichum simmondsii]